MSEPRAFVWDCKGTNFFPFSPNFFCNLFEKNFKKTEKARPSVKLPHQRGCKGTNFSATSKFIFFKFFGKSPKILSGRLYRLPDIVYYILRVFQSDGQPDQVR